jgi:hypothetical protein
MSRQKSQVGSTGQRLVWRRPLLVWLLLVVLLIPFADCPETADSQLAGIFDNSDDFANDCAEIGLNHIVEAVADEPGAFDPPVQHQLTFAPAVAGPALAAWPGLSPDERAPPRV